MAAAQYAPDFVADSNDRPAWLEARRSGIGSSDAPVILGISPFSNPFELAVKKRGIHTLVDDDDDESELLKWGHYVEGPMLSLFLKETGLKGELNSILYRSTEPGHEFMLSTPDATIIDGGEVGGAECKLKIFDAKEWEREGIPDSVITQAQHSMRVMGWRFKYVLALLDGYRLRFKRIERNDEILDEIVIPAERIWWDDFTNDRPFDPTIGKQSATDRALRRLYPEDSGETIQLAGHEWLQALGEWREAKKNSKAWKDIADSKMNRMKAAIGKATFATLDDGTELTLKTTRRDGYPVEPTSFRTLRVKGDR